METTSTATAPKRITDLVNARNAGADVRLSTVFEILPVDFHHRSQPFHAYIFLALFNGSIDQQPFEFRKCYARGCPNNLCTHVSQAVTIANRYLQRDLHRLKAAGIEAEERLFSLDDMIVKFENLKEQGQPALTIPELIAMAKSGRKIRVDIELEFLPAVEHFANQEKPQTFLSGDFTASTDAERFMCNRCFACYPTGSETSEKMTAIKVANARLNLIYDEFDQAGIVYTRQLFQ
jgi:hypothetical protein